MPRTMEEIRTAAKGKAAGSGATGGPTSSAKAGAPATSTPAALKMPAMAKGHTPAGASGRASTTTPMQAAKTPVQAAWKKPPPDMSTPIKGSTNGTHKHATMTDPAEEEEEVASSRASTPETLPEEPPLLGGEGEGEIKEFEMTVNHSKMLILISKYAQCALTSGERICPVTVVTDAGTGQAFTNERSVTCVSAQMTTKAGFDMCHSWCSSTRGSKLEQ